MHAISPPRVRGFALVIVLSLLVIVSVVLVTFTSVMMMERQSAGSYSDRTKSELLAQGALQSIQDQLLDELEAGSIRLGADGTAGSTTPPFLYRPSAAANLLPARHPELATAPDAGTLIKVSRYNVPFRAGQPATASQANSAVPSPDGRRIPLSRWNKPALLEAWPAAVAAPDWINITPTGEANVSVADARGKQLAAPGRVIGRYAYAVYNVGGLLDISQAGFPPTGSDLTPKLVAAKGNIALADLTALTAKAGTKITSEQIAELVGWRNRASKAGFHGNYLREFIPEHGGLRVFPGDDTFVNRQDLIRFAQEKDWAGALPYLTIRNLSLDAPNYAPAEDATNPPTVAAEAGLYAYRSRMDLPAAVNRDLANVRVPAAPSGWTRLDGTAAVTGEPLIKQRFALDQIALLSKDTPDAARILKCFGLIRTGQGAWEYNHGLPGFIMTLDEVARAGREPDFFELLKAVILDGSLGRDPGAMTTSATGYGPYSIVKDRTEDKDLHILTIGANIIDQYDADNFPTTIYFDAFTGALPKELIDNYVYGIENLPYLNRLIHLSQDMTPPAFNGSASYMGTWMWPVLYNPHQQGGPAVSGPAELRIVCFGSALNRVTWRTASGAKSKDSLAKDYGTSPFDASPDGMIYFQANQDFASAPVGLTSALADPDQTPAANLPSVEKPAFWPVNKIAAIALPKTEYYPDSVTQTQTDPRGEWNCKNSQMGWALQWKEAGGTWRTYNVVRRAKQAFNVVTRYNATTGGMGTDTHGDSMYLYEPRSDRFGISIPRIGAASEVMRPAGGNGKQFYWGFPGAGAGFSYGVGPVANFFPAALADNFLGYGSLPDSAMRYRDRDGLARPGDGAFKTASHGDPASGGATSAGNRPVILNRPFQSVGELGYAFRDLPFKTLDFFTERSGDLGLLDVFCVQGVGTPSSPQTIRAGLVNLNSAPAPVISALIRGGLTKENDVSRVLQEESDDIAEALATSIRATPLQHRGEVVNRLDSTVSEAFANADDVANKTQRESVVRALAEVSEVRTWNLLVDVIAQAGRYPANATDISKGFVVEGERRYWMHLSIDRLNGKVIAQHLEPVYE
jgi:Tfp pilus assembly protein PilX